MNLDYHPRYVVDACVLLAYQDPDEPHHGKALAFFQALDQFTQAGKAVEVIAPAHLYLEVNLNIEKKKEEARQGRRRDYKPRQTQERFSLVGYPVSLELMKKIEDSGLYEKFGLKLRAGDFIYASIAHLESVPLVTLDNDFQRVSSDINLILLN